jgi:hypothetical protein
MGRIVGRRDVADADEGGTFMNNLAELVLQQLGGGGISQLSQQLGTDEGTTQNAVTAAVPLLLAALARNAQQPGGADALHTALNQNHDGGLLDNVMGFLGGMSGGGAAADGAGILGHILGGQQPVVEQGLSQATGLDSSSVGQLLVMLAPLVMAALGRTQQQNGFDPSALAGFLGGQQQQAQNAAPDLMGLVGGLLDGNHDGSVIDDVASLAGRFLGGR